ncbi:hypothetical protein IPC1027_20710 [Pseudomonas aeruginosa]|nr:hypothetical protein IPC1027_20710 [Pseudomonas aeruginosa]
MKWLPATSTAGTFDRPAAAKPTFSTESAGSSPSLPDGSNPSAAIVQSASDVQCSRLLKTTG